MPNTPESAQVPTVVKFADCTKGAVVGKGSFWGRVATLNESSPKPLRLHPQTNRLVAEILMNLGFPVMEVYIIENGKDN